MRPQLATAGSWPNWRHYFKHSTRVESLWQRPNETAREIFSTILGEDPQAASLHEYADRDVPLLQRLFTLKLWLDQRATATPLSKISL
jgi:hypothetical protein